MSNKDRYADALSEFYDACLPGNTDELQEVIQVLELGLASSLATLNDFITGPESKSISEYYGEALRNLTWLAIPGAVPDESVSVDKALTSVCALSVAKSYQLGLLDFENEFSHRNEFIESMQRCCVAALMSLVTADYRNNLSEELIDSMRSEYLEDLSAINKKFVDRWSSYLLEKYGIGIRAKKTGSED